MSVAVDRPSGASLLRTTLALVGGPTPHISARIDLPKRAQSRYDTFASCVDGELDATFTGIFSEDGESFEGAGARTPAQIRASMCRTISVGSAWREPPQIAAA